ncbi:MAG TPA: tyrosine-type recombinase/integrase [Lentimicrobium sp.]|nr:tyrosine-type recombinase/integrase [Lentimicrobium sp.]
MIRESFFDHLRYEKRYSSHTVQAYKCDLTQFENYLTEFYETENEEQVTYPMVRSWLASLIESGISPRSVNRKLSSIKTYFKYLLRLGILSSNPVRFSSSLKTTGKLPSFATKKEMERALTIESDNKSFSSQRSLIVIEIFYSTGIRLAELERLCINDIDFHSETIKVTGKRNKQRIIPVSGLMLDKLKAYLKMREEIVLPGVPELIINDKGEKANRHYFYMTVKNCLTLAGVTGKKSPHVLRHTFATLMLNEGADLNAIKEILGHSSLASTQVYTHTNIEKLKTIYKQAHSWAQKKEES